MIERALIGLAAAYFALSSVLTYWSVRADIPKIRAQYGPPNPFRLAFVVVALLLTAPIFLAVHVAKERRSNGR